MWPPPPPHSYSRLPTKEYDEDSEKNRRYAGGSGWSGANSGSANRGGYKEGILELRMKEQDQSLDILGDSVSRLGDLSLNISKEIDLQNRMLTSLEIETENAHDKANILTKKTAELIKKSGGPKTFGTIICLIIVLLILIVLVIYT